MNHRVLRTHRFGVGKLTAADCVKQELRVLGQLQHPNLIWLHQIIDDPKNPNGNIYLVTEYYPNGSLGNELDRVNESRKDSDKNRRGLPLWQVRLFFIDLLKALYYCQKVIGVVHRDIKPHNIMINDSGEAVLIDFGVSANYDLSSTDKEGKDYLKLKSGTYLYFAPELFPSKNKSIKEDL
jgi:serine/threonine protein kinase